MANEAVVHGFGVANDAADSLGVTLPTTIHTALLFTACCQGGGRHGTGEEK